MVKPKLSEVIERRIPEWVASNERFLEFIKYYYEWLDSTGSSLDFIRNIDENIDVDQSHDEYLELIISKISKYIPAGSVVDKSLLIKNIKLFLQSKGSEESLNFIMQAVYGETAKRTNMSEHVLRASDNEYLQDGYISVEVQDNITNDFNLCLGSKLVQPSTNASVIIQEASYNVLGDGRKFYVLKFDPRYLNGQFSLNGNVKAIKRTANPTFVEVQDYHTVEGVDVSRSATWSATGEVIVTMTFVSSHGRVVGDVINATFTGAPKPADGAYTVYSVPSDTQLTFLLTETMNGSGTSTVTNDVNTIRINATKQLDLFKGLIIETLGDTFRAEIESIIAYTQSGNDRFYDLVITNVTGSCSNGDVIYIVTKAEEDSHLTTNDYCIGVVSECISNFEHIDVGAGYHEGIPISLTGGSGSGVNAFVGDIVSGSVDEVHVIAGGSGYQVGDKVSLAIDPENTITLTEFDVEVDKVDGYGARLHPTMEVHNIIIKDGGTNYTVNDRITVPSLQGLELNVDSVTTVGTPTLTKFKILKSGTSYNAVQSAVLIPSTQVSYSGGTISITGAITPIAGLTIKTYGTKGTSPYAINLDPNTTFKRIDDIEILTAPTPAANLVNAYLMINGFGAAVNETMTGGVIDGLDFTGGNVGYNYRNPIAKVIATDNRTGKKNAQIIVNASESDGKLIDSIAISNITWTNSYVTVTTGSAHNIKDGAKITITGMIPAGYNGKYTVSKINSTSFKYFLSANPGAYSTLGTIKGWQIVDGGEGYALGTTTIQILEGKDGSGCIAQTICDTATTGLVTAMSVVTNGDYVSLPSTSVNIPISHKSATGYDLKIDLTYKIKSIAVIESGEGYLHPLQTIVDSTSGVGEGAILYPIISGGIIESIVVASGGYGYHSQSVIELSNGVVSGAATLVVNDNGIITGVNVTNGGSGYTSSNFTYTINKPTLTLGQAQVDADVVIDGAGSIVKVDVIKAGYGYKPATTNIYIDGSSTTPATLVANVFTGVDQIRVDYVGAANAFIINQSDPWKTVVDNQGNPQQLLYKTEQIVGGNYGLLNYYVDMYGKIATLNGQPAVWAYPRGSNYLDFSGSWIAAGITATITINGHGFVTGSKVRASFTGSPKPADGVYTVTFVDANTFTIPIASTTGTGTIALNGVPYVIVGDGAGAAPIIELGSSGKIESVTVSVPGSGYNKFTQVYIRGEGAEASLSPQVDGSGQIKSITINAVANTNKNYTSLPTLEVVDQSGVGAISKVKVIKGGSGFRRFPLLTCEHFESTQIIDDGNVILDMIGVNGRPNPAIGAKLLASSRTIGSVRTINQTKFGYGYYESPEVVYPLVVLVDSTYGFKINEQVGISSGSSSANIGEIFVGVTSTGTSQVTLNFTSTFNTIAFNVGQVLTIVNDPKFHANIRGKVFTVMEIDQYTKTITASCGSIIPAGTYIRLSGTYDAADLVQSEKLAKIIKIDSARNMMWLENADNMYDFIQDTSYLAEGGSFEGFDIVTEFQFAINQNNAIYGKSYGAKAQILWSSKANSVANQMSIGKTKKIFTSNKGLLNQKGMRVINSRNVQDYSYEVKTGLDVKTYGDMLRHTVHPAGYYLSGIVEDETYIINQLQAGIPEILEGQTANYIALAIIGALGSLYYLRQYDESASKELYAKRFNTNSVAADHSINALSIPMSDFDLWTYPEYRVWRASPESDPKDYTVWYGLAQPADVRLSTSHISGSYSQLLNDVTFTSTSHGFKVGDGFTIMNPDHDKFENRSFVVTNVADTNNFKFYDGTSETITSTGTIIAIKLYDELHTCAFTRSSNLVTVTHNSHGIVHGPNTFVYVDLPNDGTVNAEVASMYCNVVSSTTNNFVIDTVITGSRASGNLKYGTTSSVPRQFGQHVKLSNVAYGIVGNDVTITGLPSTHTLIGGNVILVEWSGGYKYFTISSITDTTATFVKGGGDSITGTMNIKFTLDQTHPAEIGFGQMTTFSYAQP